MFLRQLYSNRKVQHADVGLTEKSTWHISSAHEATLATTTRVACAITKRVFASFVDCFDSLDVVLLTASVSIRALRYLTGRHIAQANVAVGRLSGVGHVWCLASSV